MCENAAFADFIRRIRDGDDQAARELVQLYEPVIRREVRLRLRDQRLASRYDLEQPDQLRRLLVTMTRHKLTKQVRRHRADRRDYRRLESRDPAYLEGRPAADPSPSRLVAGRELLDEFRRQLSAE